MNKILYLDCPTGIAGDMLLAALVDAGADSDKLCEQLRQLPIGEWEMSFSRVEKQGISALHTEITFPHQHHHRTYRDIRELIDATNWTQRAKELAQSCFLALAQAEAKVHNATIDEVHFHEAGAVDSLLDMCGASLLIDQLQISGIYFSQLPLSSGTVTCAHGILPVPAPAAALLMQGMRLFASELQGETVTPTGAALLAGSGAIQQLPAMTIQSIGYGAGSRDFEQQPNVLRAIIGNDNSDSNTPLLQDSVEVLHSNIDDGSGELLAQLWEKAFAMGALDMSYAPLMMKKGRPAWRLELIVPDGRAGEFAELIFRESCTSGLRYHRENRYLLSRRLQQVSTAFGEIAVKISGDTIAPEADQVAAAAAQAKTSFKTVYQAAIAAYLQQNK